MKLTEIIQIIQGTQLTSQTSVDSEIKGCCSADLMSDVLAATQPEALLLTGLCNPQVVRTAQMADICAIVFVRGKIPPPETVELADQEGIPLITSPHGMFELSGRLYNAGLPSLESSLAPSNA